MVVNAASHPYFKPLHQLAAIFAEKKLGFWQVDLIRYLGAIGEKLYIAAIQPEESDY
jgi:hypothetical protein